MNTYYFSYCVFRSLIAIWFYFYITFISLFDIFAFHLFQENNLIDYWIPFMTVTFKYTLCQYGRQVGFSKYTIYSHICEFFLLFGIMDHDPLVFLAFCCGHWYSLHVFSFLPSFYLFFPFETGSHMTSCTPCRPWTLCVAVSLDLYIILPLSLRDRSIVLCNITQLLNSVYCNFWLGD